ALSGAGGGGGKVGAEVNRALGSRRRELDYVVVARAEVGVKPPSEAAVEFLRAVHVRDRDGDDLELHVDLRDTRGGGRVLLADGGSAHGSLLNGVRGARISYRAGVAARLTRPAAPAAPAAARPNPAAAPSGA